MLLALAVLAVGLTVLRPAGAAVVVVGCSAAALHTAVDEAGTNGEPDELVLAGDCTYALERPLVVDDGQRLVLRRGSGTRTLLDGGGATQVLRGGPGTELVVAGLELVGGRPRTVGGLQVGGAVEAQGPLRLDAVVVSGTRAAGTAPAVGAAVHAAGGLSMTASAVLDSAVGTGSAVLVARGRSTVVNSTVATSGPGTTALESRGDLRLVAVSLGHNEGTALRAASGTVVLVSSVLSENPTACATAAGASVLDGGGNVVSDATCALQSGSLQSVSAQLARPARIGGATPALDLPAGSPARDAGNPDACQAPVAEGGSGGVDQRGFPRPDAGPCDAGAVEKGPSLRRLEQVAFGDVAVATTAESPVPLVNDGDEPMTVADVVLEGSPDLTLADDPCSGTTVGPGLTCTVRVQYAPLLPGEDTATLTATPDRSAARTTTVTGNGAPTSDPPPPSASPTTSPTAEPTAEPTVAPTAEPTAEPTVAPTAEPTAEPTLGPTVAPTAEPTLEPTVEPVPTGEPTDGPTTPPGPTASPTTTPTADPTTSPSASPTSAVVVPPGPGPAPDPVTPPGPSPSAGPTVVDPLQVAEQRELDTRRGSIARSLTPPDEVSFAPEQMLRNGLLALLLLALIGVPLAVLNATLESHRADIAAMLAPVRRPLARLPRPRVALSQPLAYASLAVLSAVVYSQLAPGLTLSSGGAVQFLGLLLTVVVTSVITKIAMVAFLVSRLRTWARLTLFPGFLLLALGCVVLTRVLELSPGLLLGSLGGLAVARTLSEQERGRRTAFAYAMTAVLSVYAYLCWGPVADAAAMPGSGFEVRLLDTVLASVALGGVEGIALGLMPIAFLDGPVLRAHRPRLWAALWAGATFAFVHVALNPTSGDDDAVGREGYLAVLLVVYLLVAAAVWGFFRYRDRRPGAGPRLLTAEPGAAGEAEYV